MTRIISKLEGIFPQLYVKIFSAKTTYYANRRRNYDEKWKLCYEMLKKTSRSFSLVILLLNESLRDVNCIFYILLRALDTIEDDDKVEINQKIRDIKEFSSFLLSRKRNISGYGTGNSKELLENFGHVADCFFDLDIHYQKAILLIVNEMGSGMIEFLDRSIITERDWDEYCYYVAGLVGIGLSNIFSLSDEEDEIISLQKTLSISMGLLLQKTNVIRDFLEDIDENRIFWPEDIWKKYTDSLESFRHNKSSEAIHCLNQLIINALQHIPDSLTYLSYLRQSTNFNFCAIPQVMALATLSLCYGNPEVFTRNVKIDRNESAKIIMSIIRGGMPSLIQMYEKYISIISSKVENEKLEIYSKTVNYDIRKIESSIQEINNHINQHKRKHLLFKMNNNNPFSKNIFYIILIFILLLSLLIVFYK